MANFDETMVTVGEQVRVLVVTPWNTLPIVEGSKTYTTHVTMGVFIFANGTDEKPELIINRKHIPQVSDSTRNSFIWHFQWKGWVTSAIMLESITNQFIPAIQRRRRENNLQPDARAVLFLDGHSSHVTPELMKAL